MNKHKEKMLLKWPPEFSGNNRCESFAAHFPTIEKLHEFHHDTRALAWAESFGESPWAFASTVAHLVFNSESNVPEHFHEPWRGDLVRAIEDIETRNILAGERADIFQNVLFRAISKGLICTNTGDRPTRYAPFKFDGLGFRDVHFIAYLLPKGNSPLDGDIVLYRAQHLPTQKNPVATYSVRDVIKYPTAKLDLTELGRIFRFGNSCDGYQWGDTRGGDGNYGAETLACLTLLGYARRSGANVPNGLGGSWPEVEVTPNGILAILQSNVLMTIQREFDNNYIAVPVASLTSSWGDLTFCAHTGAVLGFNLDAMHPEVRLEDIPVRVDVAELAQSYTNEEIDGQTYDILNVGYWMADGRYETPEDEFREELRHCRAAP